MVSHSLTRSVRGLSQPLFQIIRENTGSRGRYSPLLRPCGFRGLCSHFRVVCWRPSRKSSPMVPPVQYPRLNQAERGRRRPVELYALPRPINAPQYKGDTRNSPQGLVQRTICVPRQQCEA